jgi:hypothetical protein
MLAVQGRSNAPDRLRRGQGADPIFGRKTAFFMIFFPANIPLQKLYKFMQKNNL